MTSPLVPEPEPQARLGLYLHVPFCSRPCDFCAFFQVQSDRQGIREYIEGVKREVELLGCDQEIDTCFWGGGTPSLLPAKDLEILCGLVIEEFGRPRDEWTVEMAPSSVKRDKLQALKDCGVNRVSLGIQSFDAALLESLGRPHSLRQAMEAYERIRQCGFENVNLDLIFAIPGQEPSQLRADLRRAIALDPDHISTYCLTFEEDTALYVKLAEGRVSIDAEREAELYRTAWEELEEAGYQQYEISNYAKPGKQCIHNRDTWRMGDWIGLGPSAASQYKGRRYSNPSDLERWLADLRKGVRGAEGIVELSGNLLFEDGVIFGLRMNEGVDVACLAERFGPSDSSGVRARLEEMAMDGLAIRMGERYRLAERGRLVADAIGAELLGRG